jgi:hypothetical protein
LKELLPQPQHRRVGLADSLAPIREHTVSIVFKEGRDKDPSMLLKSMAFLKKEN